MIFDVHDDLARPTRLHHPGDALHGGRQRTAMWRDDPATVLEEVGTGRHWTGVLGTSHRMRADVALERYVAFPQRVQNAGLDGSDIGYCGRRVCAQRVADDVWDRRRWNCHDDHTDIRRPWRLND